MIEILRTNSDNKDFKYLVSELDKNLAIRNGETNNFFAQYNKIDKINNAVVAYFEKKPVGCGAIKEYDNNVMEIKRMFVPYEMRRKGITVAILKNLEMWAKELKYNKCNYNVIPNYGQYKNIESSICFEKYL